MKNHTRWSTLSVLFLALSGCSALYPKSSAGPVLNPADAQKMAEDTVKKLRDIYPPAQSFIIIQQPALNDFDQYLRHDLRSAGYAVQDSKDTTEQGLQQLPSAAEAGTTTGSKINLTSLLDQTGEPGLLRITLKLIPAHVLSRAYRLNPAGGISAASPWIYQE